MRPTLRRLLRAATAFCIAGIASIGASAQVDITTWQVNLQHTGANLQETQLTPASVTATGGFGLLFTQALDGQSYGQPLYVSSATLGKFADGTLHNVVYVATEHDSVYAFDADSSTAAPLWHDSLLPAGTTPVPQGDVGSGDIQVELGITATPAIDTVAGTLYIVSKVKTTSNGTYQQYLHALDLKTGVEKAGSPVLINPTFVGTSSDSVGGVIPFNPLREHLRSAIALYNGVVYLAYASHSDTNPYHGEILGYNASTLALVSTFISTPGGNEGGFWAGGASPAIDVSGNMFVPTGNGPFSQNSGAGAAGNNWGESMLKLPTNATGAITIPYSNTLNWFTPNNWNTLNGGDLDVGAGGLTLLPDQTGGSHTHIMVGGGKGSVLYVVDRDNLSGLNNPDGVIQEISDGGDYNFSTPAYFNGYIYYAPGGDSLLQRAVGYNAATGDYISPTAIESTQTWAGKGASVFISANGSTNGLVWLLNGSTMAVYNANNVSGQSIYHQYATVPQGSINCASPKFALPIVDNGKVYYTAFNASTNQSYLFVSGLLNVGTTPPAIPQAPTNASAMALTSSTTSVMWTSNSTNEAGFTISRSTTSTGSFQTAGTVGAGVTTYTDTGLTPDTTYYYEVQAYNASGNSSAASTTGVTTFPLDRPTGLVAYLPLDDGSVTTVIDATGNGHNGTITGEVTTSAGYINGAYLFHGTGFAASNIVIPNAATLQFSATQSFSISAYVNPSNVDSKEQAILAKSADQGNEYGIFINAANQWVFRGPNGDIVGPTVVQGQWTNVAAVQDGSAGNRTLYVNGAVAGTGTAQAADGAGDFWIGQQNSSTLPDSFPGLIDEVRVYNTALTAEGVSDQLAAPVLGAISNQTQGSAGTFGLPVYPSPTQVVESREGSTAGSYSVALTFSAPVTGVTPQLQLASGGTAVGTIASATPDSTKKILTLKLTGVADAQPILIHLSGIQPGNGTADIPFNILWGDVNGDGVVSQADVTADQAQFTSQVNATSFPFDINGDGAVNSADAAIITANLGTSLTGGTTPPATPPSITSALTATGTVGTAFSYQITATNTPTNFTATNLPANLTLNPTSGLITGTPTAAGSTSITLGATNAGGTGTATLVLTIAAAPTPPAITSALTATGTVGTAFSYQITASGTPTSYTATNLPSSLTLNPTTGLITGTPTTTGTSSVTLGATNAAGTGTATLALTIAAASTPPPAGVVYQINSGGPATGTFVADEFYNTGATSHTSTAITVAAGDTAPMQVYQTDRYGGGFIYTFSGLTAGASYTVRLHFAEFYWSAAGKRVFNVAINGVSELANFDIFAAAGGENIGIVRSFTVNANASGQILVTFTTGTADLPKLSGIELVSNGGGTTTAPSITSALTAAGTVGSAFSYQIAASNTPTSYTATNLPANLSLNPTTGLITGTPTTAGTSSVTLGATNSAGTGTATLVLTIAAAPIPAITSALTASGTVNAAFTYQVVASNTPTSYSATNLPGGLSISPTTGVISGTPTTAATSSVMLDATNAAGTGTAVLTLTIAAASTTTPSVVYQINSGGAAVGSFAADEFFNTGATSQTSATITLPAGDSAPMQVYQSDRYGGSFTYTFTALTPGASYTVNLHFAETYWTAAGQRVFNVAINGVTELSDFDIFATAGGADIGIIRSFTLNADANGQIMLAFTTGTGDLPKVNGVELISNGGPVSTPVVVGPPVTGTPVYQISAGGPAYAPFAAEEFFTGGGTSTSNNIVNTSLVVSPAPEHVYQSERNGGTFSFVFPKLTPGKTYLVRLHFAETYFTAVGKRVFNVSINGNTVLTNFDIFKAAGAANTAVIESFTTTADANGNITVNYFGATANQPKASALEIYAQ